MKSLPMSDGKLLLVRKLIATAAPRVSLPSEWLRELLARLDESEKKVRTLLAYSGDAERPTAHELVDRLGISEGDMQKWPPCPRCKLRGSYPGTYCFACEEKERRPTRPPEDTY